MPNILPTFQDITMASVGIHQHKGKQPNTELIGDQYDSGVTIFGAQVLRANLFHMLARAACIGTPAASCRGVRGRTRS